MALPLVAAALYLGAALAANAQGAPSERTVPATARAQSPGIDLTRYNDSIVRVDAKAPAEATSSQQLGPVRFGNGIILDERTVLTIGYLTLEADAVMVTTAAGRRIPGTVAGYDHASGFSVVQTALPLDGKPMPLGDSDALKERDRVLVLGAGEPEATEIVVLSRKPFSGSWEYLIEQAIFTFPPVNNWSGAALFTHDGKLLGVGSLIVNDAAANQPGVPGNMWVPVNLLKPILDDLIAKGRRSGAVQPWLGITTESVRGNLMVTRVAKAGPAEEAGITPGDIVLGVGADKVTDQAEFYRKVWSHGPAGTTVTLRLLKDGDVKEVPVKSIDRHERLHKARGI
ncbi:MAG TPA: S1C family serine protease [Burkholderiaceae bacterium]|nr:S1C family serine protease [Burkholderiaceae bacterium]